MLVRDAREVARAWVAEEGSTLPGFAGAYFAGSANWLAEDALLPATSDLDVNVVVSAEATTGSRTKLVWREVLIEITSLPIEQIRSPEVVLGDYHLAGGFRTPSVIADPTGHLTELQRVVSRDYARRYWVRRRCLHAADRVMGGLAMLDGSGSFHDQVIGWLFPTGVTTHVLLVAGLQNPTVRRRYTAVRDLLAGYGLLAFHETLLELLGSARICRDDVEGHLDALTEAFDRASAVIRSPFAFASDIGEIARPLAIEGTQEMIADGRHREAMFWIAVTYSRCQRVLEVDAPAELKRFEPGYRAVLHDLGITSFADIQERRERVMASLPRVLEVADAIMVRHPEIDD